MGILLFKQRLRSFDDIINLAEVLQSNCIDRVKILFVKLLDFDVILKKWVCFLQLISFFKYLLNQPIQLEHILVELSNILFYLGLFLSLDENKTDAISHFSLLFSNKIVEFYQILFQIELRCLHFFPSLDVIIYVFLKGVRSLSSLVRLISRLKNLSIHRTGRVIYW